MPTLPDFRLETYFARWEFTARYHLTASDAETLPMAELLALADDDGRQRWESLTLGYTETRGLPALREEIARTYENVQPEDVLCFAGAEEAIYLAMHVLLDPGDHAVVLTPNYQAAETIPLSICEVTGVPLRPEDGWALDVEAIEAALRPTTRLVSVNFPNNPTGAVADAGCVATPRGPVHRARDHVVQRRGLPRAGAGPYAAAAGRRPLTHGDLAQRDVQGLRPARPADRLGRLPRPELLHRLGRAKDYTTICNSAPSEVLALIGLRAREVLLDRNRRIVADNLPTFAEFFGRFPELFAWEAAAGRMRLLPAVPRSLTAWKPCVPTWWSRPACCCCPRACTGPS